MSFKSILTVWDGHKASIPTLNAAIEMAQSNDAHLHVLCVGFNQIEPAMYYSETSTLVMNDDFQTAKEDAQARKESAEEILKLSPANWSCQSIVTSLNALSPIIKKAAWFNDLVILPQPYGRDFKDQSVATFESALFEGNAPVLVHPLAVANTIGKRVIIAWNESGEALNAARAALPFLQAAELVDIAIVDPGIHDPQRSDPGLDLSKMLSRHGVKVTVTILSRSVPKVSDVLSQHAVDFGADLIVMGAYGHSRLREFILGGATRDMLAHIKLPVLMAH